MTDGVVDNSGNWTPKPDPTALTTDAMRRESAILQELIDLRFQCADRVSDALHENIKIVEANVKRELADYKEHMNERAGAQEKAIIAALDSAEKAVLKAEDLATARAIAQNEWRATMTDLVAKTLQRPEYESAHSALIDRVDMVSSRLDRIEGQGQGKQESWGLVIGAIAGTGTLLGILVILLQLFSTH